MTVYRDAVAAHSAAADLVFSEDWTYRAAAAVNGDVNARPAPDVNRQELQIVGAFLDPYARAFSGETRRQGLKAESPGHASARPQIEFDTAQLPFPPRRGDHLIRQATRVVYMIAEVKFPSAGTRVVADLNQIADPA